MFIVNFNLIIEQYNRQLIIKNAYSLAKIFEDDNFTFFGQKRKSDAFFNINEIIIFIKFYLNKLIINSFI